MGYLIVPDIKNEEVVCQQPCNHKDCTANRRDFGLDSKCRICGMGFNAGDTFYYENTHEYPDNHTMVHAGCYWDETEKAEHKSH